MSEEESRRGLRIHELLLECANGRTAVDETSQAIVEFAQGESAPDGPILSDLLLDTLFLYDSGVSNDDEQVLQAQRENLGSLIAKLIEGGCITENDAYGRLEAPLLFAAKLIPDAKAFEKKHVRINTNLLYKQQKFNLFREDNEGYSKLIVEVETFLSTTANVASENKAQELLNNVQSLIGYFDLDPNRVLDVLIELMSASVLTHWRFLIPLLKMSPWFVLSEQPEGDMGAANGDLAFQSGNKSAAQIIGFKFQQLRQSTDDDANLIMLTALLIKEGLIRLQDIWTHLSPDDTVLAKEKSLYQDRILDEVDKAKGRNALAMAGGLDDEESKIAEGTAELPNGDASDASKKPLEDKQQKLPLLYALLCIGALKESSFVLSEFPFLINSHPHLAEAFAIILEHIIEPLWSTIRPHTGYPRQALDTLHQPRKVPQEPKYRDSSLILPRKPRVLHVLNPLNRTSNAVLKEEFFYDQVDSQLKLCTSLDLFEAIVLPHLRLLGLQLYRNVTLCTKIARIGKAALLSSTNLQATRNTWQSILRGSLLPALSLIDTNPATVNDIFSLIKEYTTEERYSLYGEWYSDSYKKMPELKVQFVKTEKETKSLLRRISKTNTKEYGRRLAKVSHTNPCIVLNIALNQIESYDNLVDVVIEASRYFTLLSFDVLVYVMLTLLSNTQKRRLKEDGTSVAHWLQSLSSFTAKIFKRYSHMDASPITIYVAKQLKVDNAFDLIILRDLISEMAGIRPTSDLSEDQLQGCSGGPALQVEALSLINDRRDQSARAPARLIHALDKAKLTIPLAILIGQQRSKCIYMVAEDQSLVKLLANLSDEVHQILLQYMEFVALNTEPSVYAASIPSIPQMLTQSSLEPCVAFMIARPAIAQSLHSLTAQDASSETPDDTVMTDAVDTKASVKLEGEPMADEDAKDTPDMHVMHVMQENVVAQFSAPVLESLVSQLRETLPQEVWTMVTAEFYTIFWSLSLYDLLTPTSRYEKARSALQGQIKDIELDKVDASQYLEKTKSSELARLRKSIEEITSELTAQQQNVKVISKLFTQGKAIWFALPEGTEPSLQSTFAILQHCLLPRCLVSPNDAVYCAEFLGRLQATPYSGLDLMALYKTIFGAHLATSIFTCTEREAENLGRFLGQVLDSLNSVAQDQSLFDSSALRSPLDSESSVDNEQAWKDFNTTWYDSFHRTLWTTVKACFESKDYMHIRNLLIVLEKMSTAFPHFKWIGNNIAKEVDKVISTERREDLKIRALGYKAVLKRQQSRWRDPPGKQHSVAPASAAVTTRTSPSAESEAKPQIDTQMPDANDIAESGVTNAKDTDVQDKDRQGATGAESAESGTPTTTTTTPTTAEIQKENARKAAASINQALKEKDKPRVRRADIEADKRTSPAPNAASVNGLPKPEASKRSRDDRSRTTSRASSPQGTNADRPLSREARDREQDLRPMNGRDSDPSRNVRRGRQDQDSNRAMLPPESNAGRLSRTQSQSDNRREVSGSDSWRRPDRNSDPRDLNAREAPSRARDTPSGPRTPSNRERATSHNLETDTQYPSGSLSGDRRSHGQGRNDEPITRGQSIRSSRDDSTPRSTRPDDRASAREARGAMNDNARGSREQPSKPAQTQEPYVHPSRQVANSPSSSSPIGTKSNGQSRSAPLARNEPHEPLVHSSRQAILTNKDDRGHNNASPDSRAATGNRIPSRDLQARHDPVPSRDSHNARPVNTRDRRADYRSEPSQDSRGPPSRAPAAASDGRAARGGRNGREAERLDSRRDVSDRPFRDEQHDGKRRHAEDSRDSQRPSKRRF